MDEQPSIKLGDYVRYAGPESAMRSEGEVINIDPQFIWIRTSDNRELGMHPWNARLAVRSHRTEKA